jgi:hypothetical protein
MIPVYANSLTINMNELAMLEFRINTQSVNGPVSVIAVQYEFLKQVYAAIGNSIEQHDKHLHELQRSKANMN